MSSDTKLMKDEEGESVDSTKYRGMVGTTHLGLWYPKGSSIEAVVYVDSDHAGYYVDRKSTSGLFLHDVLDRLCHLTILCLDQHAHTLHHLESLLTISLDRLDILKEDLVYQSLRKSLSLILKVS
ncbi:hypothetical protein Tco_0343291 [Tanacetum coccineum]